VSENPCVTHEQGASCTENYSIGRHLKSWTARSNFLWETVNSERYLSVLHNTFVPRLLATHLPLQTQWFMQDGARPHTANVVFNFQHDTFDWHVISNRFPKRFARGQNWRRIPDLNSCDYFLSGFLKEKIFPKKPQTITELRALIIQAPHW
jgi:hypothetical protein